MAVANITLFVNITAGTLVASSSSAAQVAPPVVTVGDIYNLRVCIVEANGAGVGTQLSVLDPSGLALKVGIGVPDAGAPDVLTIAFTPAGNFLVGILDCSTAALQAKVTAGTALSLEIEISEGATILTAFQASITCRKQVIPSNATTPLCRTSRPLTGTGYCDRTRYRSRRRT